MSAAFALLKCLALQPEGLVRSSRGSSESSSVTPGRGRTRTLFSSLLCSWRGRAFAAALAAILSLSACATDQKKMISSPTRTANTAEKSTGSARASKPISGDSSKKPTASAKQTAAKQQPKPAPDLPPPTYADIANAYNARAARLQRVWARAVVSVDFTDDEGNRRWEQGEGHFQVIQPSKMALSAGKLGEVMLWIGCDTDRYWLIDAKEKHRAWVGKHSAATRQKIESLGVPAAPRDLLALAGITPLPNPTNDQRLDPQPRWSNDKKTLIFDADRTGTRWRYFINPKTYEPSRIEVIDPATSEPILTATLELYDNLTIRGDGTLPPRIATRFRCLHHPSGSTLGLSITDMIDGGPTKLREQNFDFDALHELLGIKDTIDLDAPRPAAAAVNNEGRD